MKSPIITLRFHRQRGVALLVVLAFLVILFGLAVAFLLRTNIERSSAASFAAEVSTSQLADVCVNLVQGQIRDATTQGTTVAWASQPGMIRNFDVNGAPTRAYKLYSASSLIYSGSDVMSDVAADAPPATWAADTAHWSDLNAAVMVPNPAGGSAPPVASYPILDLAAIGNVQGLSVVNPPTAGVPMPVRWLYQLQDGSLVAPQAGTGATATISGASNSNPIVGRVAFWTDDETCKLNINTSSEGTYWDVPKFFTPEDLRFARFQPGRNEFQRYPGHPAMTSLAPVFFFTSNATSSFTLNATQRDAIYSMAPRIIGGGSNAGTLVPPGPLTPDSDRLYASVDELYFTANPTRNPQLASAGISTQKLGYSRFFLTASSRAPEITLFNTPRVAMWPIDVETSDEYRSAYDRLLAFCSTINGQPYYFQRSDPGSQSADFPGAPTTDPQTGLGRNRNIYAYLQDLTSRPIPGFGGTMLDKYGADRNQILTSMFDYIRTTNVDDSTLRGVTPDGTSRRYGLRRREGPTNDFNRATFDGWRLLANSSGAFGFNQVVPIRIGDTRGGGRFPVISEAGIVFIASADGSGFTRNGAKPSLAECGGLANAKAANDAKLDSNLAANRTLGGTLLKGEGYLDVGYGSPTTGAENGLFNWDDSTPTSYPIWQNNGTCDFEPFDDVNTDGLYTTGERYWDANNNGQWDGERHEPLHDWGRTNSLQPPWNPAYWNALPTHAVWTQVDWAAFLASRNLDTASNGRYERAERRIEALFLIQPFLPAQGYPAVNSNFSVRVRGLESFRVTAAGEQRPLNFPSDGLTWWRTSVSQSIIGSRHTGGVLCPRWGFNGRFVPQRGVMPADTPAPGFNVYPFVSHPVTVNVAAGTMEFSGGTVTVEIYAKGLPIPASQELVQTITLEFPAATIPIPELVPSGTPYSGISQDRETAMQDWWTFSADGCLPGTVTSFGSPMPPPTTRSLGRLGLAGLSVATNGPVYRGGSLFRDQDVVRTLIPANHSDYRLLARPELGAAVYAPHPNYGNSGHRLAHSLIPESNPNVSAANPGAFPGATFPSEYLAGITFTAGGVSTRPKVSIHHPNSITNGDWDNGIGLSGDGAFINLPDGGNATGLYGASEAAPYFMSTFTGGWLNSAANYSNNPSGGYTMEPIFTLHSPNRQVPSAGMFGSLPSGIQAGVPFRTLLFRPQANHFGSSAPRDHLWADLFWMPVVEPYAISEPFSTGGKINMNYQIMPFRYLVRQTALYGLLRNEQIPAIPNNQILNYKGHGGLGQNYRRLIDIPQTLTQFESVFANNRVFVSPTEICDIHLVPEGQTLAALAAGTFQANHRLTGDNSRERPYTNLLGRLTTKSNTYTVHYRVQSLKKRPASAANVWNEGADRVVSESRGSTLIERYINPNDPAIPDYATAVNPPDLGTFYKWRVVNTRAFAP